MTRSRRARRALAVAVCIATALLAGPAAPAAADEARVPGTAPFSFFDDWAAALAGPDRAFLTGDWGGLRTRLLDLGITPNLAFVTDVLGNPIGGRRQAVRESDELALSLTADLDRLAGWAGVRFYLSFSIRSGTSLSDRDIGNVFTVHHQSRRYREDPQRARPRIPARAHPVRRTAPEPRRIALLPK